MRYFRVITYILREMLPSLLIGILVFTVILLMFQALRLADLVVSSGVSFSIVSQLIMFLFLSFLPAILPMSVLFSVLMTYGKLSSDSEIIAFKSLGISQRTLTWPAILLGVIMFVVSAQTYFFWGPEGHGHFSELIDEIAGTQVISNIREGTFAEGFYDLVVYANHVNEEKGILKDVFIYDARSAKQPLTIIAPEGQILTTQASHLKTTILRLFNGSIHAAGEGVYTKIQFNNYDIFLSPFTAKQNGELSEKDMTITQLWAALHSDKVVAPDKYKKLEVEYYRRWTLPIACIIFSLIGVGLGTIINRRMARSGGFVVSVGLLVGYYASNIFMETLASNGTLSPAVALSLPSVIFLAIAVYSLRLIWNK